MSHTFVELEVSAALYDEVYRLLKAAGYDHALLKGINSADCIDMHGIALVKKVAQPTPQQEPTCVQR